MQDGTDNTSTAVVEAPACPSWCTGAHVSHPGRTEDFHHDGARLELQPREQPMRDSTQTLAVFPSAFVDGAGTHHAPVVEVCIDGTTARLTPVEAFSLGDSLGVTAQKLLSAARREVISQAAVARRQPLQPENVRHPVWCRQVPEDAPLAGDPSGSVTFHDRMGPAETDGEHVGREYRLDVGQGFSYSVTAAVVAMHDAGESRSEVRLSVVNQDLVDASESVYVSADQARELARMLLRVADEQELFDGPGRG